MKNYACIHVCRLFENSWYPVWCVAGTLKEALPSSMLRGSEVSNSHESVLGFHNLPWSTKSPLEHTPIIPDYLTNRILRRVLITVNRCTGYFSLIRHIVMTWQRYIRGSYLGCPLLWMSKIWFCRLDGMTYTTWAWSMCKYFSILLFRCASI